MAGGSKLARYIFHFREYSMTIARRYLISGRVQGVWYRRSCQEQALKLDLTGWVRNLHDGRVEALACGDEAGLVEFENWLKQGPPDAQVYAVRITAAAAPEPGSFEIRPDGMGE